MEKELLQIEVDLLLLKYGEDAVIKAISETGAKTENEIYEKISGLKEKKSKTPKSSRQQKQPLDIAKEIVTGSSNESQLIKLAILYQNKQFLPQLKDVKRLLGRFNINKNIKSRNEATRIVFESLSRYSLDELNNLTADSNTNGQSSFAKLAEHIMGDGDNKSSSQ